MYYDPEAITSEIDQLRQRIKELHYQPVNVDGEIIPYADYVNGLESSEY